MLYLFSEQVNPAYLAAYKDAIAAYRSRKYEDTSDFINMYDGCAFE